MAGISDLVINNPAAFVPPHALFYGPLGGVPTATTFDTPLPVSAQLRSPSLIERLNREGDPFSNYSEATFTSFALPTGAGTAAASPMPTPGPGRAVFVQQFQFWSTTPIAGRAQIGLSTWNTGVGTSTQMDIGFACGPNYPARLDVNAFARSSDKAGIGSYVRRWYDPAVSGTHYVGGGATGFTLADSINFDAKKVILFMGDSLWNGTGPTSVQTCIPWLVNGFYRDQGIDCRYILKAYSGSTSSGHETYRQGGKYEFERVDAIFYNLGINDAVQGYTTATSIANIQKLIAWKQKRYPAARLVILGPTPVQAAASEATLASLRSAELASVVAAADPSVLYCDLGNSFDRAVGANYVTSDGADGTRIHPADAGLTQQWAGGYAGNPGLRAWLAANLPAI